MPDVSVAVRGEGVPDVSVAVMGEELPNVTPEEQIKVHVCLHVMNSASYNYS